MPYPFLPAITLAELKERLRGSFGVKCIPVSLQRVKCDSPVSQSYFLRETDHGDVRFIPVPKMHDDDRLTPSVLRSVCLNLGVNPAEFGLHLG